MKSQTGRNRLLAEMVYGCLSKQIGPHIFELPVGEMFTDKLLVQHFYIAFATQGFEIAVGKKVDVGGVVPLIGQLFGHRHAAAQCQVGAGFPVAEIGEGDNTFAANAQHFVEHQVGVAHRL
jgi:hypothetical protein